MPKQTPEALRCGALTKAGTPCTVPRLPNVSDGRCLMHSMDPWAVEKRAQGTAHGGGRRSIRLSRRVIRLKDVDDVRFGLEEIVNALRDEQGTARNASLLLKAYELALECIGQGETDEKLERLGRVLKGGLGHG